MAASREFLEEQFKRRKAVIDNRCKHGEKGKRWAHFGGAIDGDKKSSGNMWFLIPFHEITMFDGMFPSLLAGPFTSEKEIDDYAKHIKPEVLLNGDYVKASCCYYRVIQDLDGGRDLTLDDVRRGDRSGRNYSLDLAIGSVHLYKAFTSDIYLGTPYQDQVCILPPKTL